jgi:hypothetical protein
MTYQHSRVTETTRMHVIYDSFFIPLPSWVAPKGRIRDHSGMAFRQAAGPLRTAFGTCGMPGIEKCALPDR